ncbi:hypothetical protein HY492_03410 [Candidatus Woesearchaeota archaeon]|nr:hypothetical protein [Candidatus Woesearchaeota archaeon]
MEILGIIHDDSHPDFDTTLKYLDQHVTKSSVVALEGADLSIDELNEPTLRKSTLTIPEQWKEAMSVYEGFVTLKTTTHYNDSFYHFFSKVAQHVQDRCAKVITVDNIDAHNEGTMLSILLNLQEGLTSEQWRAKYEAAVKRSIAMYEQANEHHATHLIVGGMHAYDIKRIFSVPVTHFTKREFDPRDNIETREKAIRKLRREYAHQ